MYAADKVLKHSCFLKCFCSRWVCLMKAVRYAYRHIDYVIDWTPTRHELMMLLTNNHREFLYSVQFKKDNNLYSIH